MIVTRSKYHLALNDVGLILQNSPQEPAYAMEQAVVFNSRFASGDRSYDDFSKWWFWAQTDWYQGIKDDVAWADDGKYYYSTNIDTYSQPGAIILAPAPTLDEDFTDDIDCGLLGDVNGNVSKFIATDEASDSRPHIFQASGSSWNDISTTNINTNQNNVSQMSARAGKLMVSCIGIGSTGIFNYWTGSAWTEQGAAIASICSITPTASRTHITIGDAFYIFVDSPLNDFWALIKTTVAAPTAGGDWAVVFEKTNDSGLPVASAEYLGNLYYIVYYNGYLELRVYDIANDVDSFIRKFRNGTSQGWGVGDKLLVVHNGSLIITIPNEEIWKLTGSSLTRIFKRSLFKNNNFGANAVPRLGVGAVIADNKVWWGNLVYDGENFYNTFKPSTDSSSDTISPLFVDTSENIFFSEIGDTTKLYSINVKSPSDYKGATADENYLVMSNFDNVSGIDKILYSATIIFKKFSSSQSITIEYTTGELNGSTSWTSLGTASYSLDGANATEKTLYFPVNTTCKKVWYRIKMQSDGTNTPEMYDIITAYLPRPFVDKQWRINVDCGNEIKLLNGSLENDRGRHIKGNLERAWLTNQIVDFQDLDYASTTITDNPLSSSATEINVSDTSEFAEAGRLRTDDEIIYYTGKTPKKFTGCLRGQKGTKAVSHTSGTAIHNGYKVIIQNFNTRVPIINDDKKLEYIAGLSLREVI